VLDDGNVVIRAASGELLWQTGTAGAESPLPTLTVDGHGSGELVQLRTNHPLNLQVHNAKGDGTEFVTLYWSTTLEPIETRPVGTAHDTTMTFTPPFAGAVSAYLYGDDSRSFATGPDVFIVAVKVTVNNSYDDVDVQPSSTFTVHVPNPGGKADDWVGLFHVGSSNETPVARQYLNGAQTPPISAYSDATLTFAAPSPSDSDAENNYEIRLIEGGTNLLLAVSPNIHILAFEPELRINGKGKYDTVSIRPNHPITVDLDRDPHHPNEFIQLSSNVDSEQVDEHPAATLPVNGQPSVTFSAAPSGMFRVRWYYDDNGVHRYLNNGPRIQVDQSKITINGLYGNVTVDAGEPLRIRLLTNPLAQRLDWMGLYTVGAPDTPLPQAKKYLNNSVVAPASPWPSDTTLDFVTPQAGGNYEFRVFAGDTGIRLTTSPTLTARPAARLTIDGKGSGQTVTHAPNAPINVVVWDGPGRLTDWVGIFSPGQDMGENVPRKYVSSDDIAPGHTGVSNGFVTMTVPSNIGYYEVRLYTHICNQDNTNCEWKLLAMGPALNVSTNGDGDGSSGPRVTINGTGPGGEPLLVAPDAVVTVEVTGAPLFEADRVIFLQQPSDTIVAEHRLGLVPPPSFSMVAPHEPGLYRVELRSSGTNDDAVSQAASGYGPLLSVDGLDGIDSIYYYDTDAIGSVLMITDTEGVVVARKDYLPFGAEWNSTSTAAGDRVLFAGKERDPETNLDYFLSRYFSKDIGRFSTADAPRNDQNPIDPQSWNLYAYGRNNPLRFGDPSGRECESGEANRCAESITVYGTLGYSEISSFLTFISDLINKRSGSVQPSQGEGGGGPVVNCDTALPNGSNVGDYVRKYRSQLQQFSNSVGIDDQQVFAVTAMFHSIVRSRGPVDFKNIFYHQADPAMLGAAGNFSYYAIGSGMLPTFELDSAAGAYGIYNWAFGHKDWSTLSGRMFSDASADAVRIPGLSSNGCMVK
jgi:RHS repeat-associated protein